MTTLSMVNGELPYPGTKAIQRLCRWQPDAAVSRASCGWTSPASDTLYCSSTRSSTCTKGEETSVCVKGGGSPNDVVSQVRTLAFLPGTALQVLWVRKLIWSLLTPCADFKRVLHFLEHLSLRFKGHGFISGLQTSAGQGQNATLTPWKQNELEKR